MFDCINRLRGLCPAVTLFIEAHIQQSITDVRINALISSSTSVGRRPQKCKEKDISGNKSDKNNHNIIDVLSPQQMILKSNDDVIIGGDNETNTITSETAAVIIQSTHKGYNKSNSTNCGCTSDGLCACVKLSFFLLLAVIDSSLRGVAQVFLADNPISGIFITIGLCISSDPHLGALGLLGSFAGLVGGVVALTVTHVAEELAANRSNKQKQKQQQQQASSYDNCNSEYYLSAWGDALHHGLCGYDGALAACGVKVFMSEMLIDIFGHYDVSTLFEVVSTTSSTPVLLLNSSSSNNNSNNTASLGTIYCVAILLGYLCGVVRVGVARGLQRSLQLPALTITFNIIIILSILAFGGGVGSMIKSDTTAAVTTNTTSGVYTTTTNVTTSNAFCCPVSVSKDNNGSVRTSSILILSTNINDTCRILVESKLIDAFISSDALQTARESLNLVTRSSMLDISGSDWVKLILTGVSQFMFVDTIEGAVVVVVGIAWASCQSAVLAIIGSFMASLTAVFIIKCGVTRSMLLLGDGSSLSSLLMSLNSPFLFSTNNYTDYWWCMPSLGNNASSLAASSAMNIQLLLTIPIENVKKGLVGYNGAGTMTALGNAILSLFRSSSSNSNDGDNNNNINNSDNSDNKMKEEEIRGVNTNNCMNNTNYDYTDHNNSNMLSSRDLHDCTTKNGNNDTSSSSPDGTQQQQQQHGVFPNTLSFVYTIVCIISTMLLCISGVVLSVLFIAAFHVLLPANVPYMTLPFVLTTYMLLSVITTSN